MSDRDYIREMRELIDATTADGIYTARTAADEIVEKLKATDPGLLSGWLDMHAVQLLRDAIGRRDHSIRTRARFTSKRRAFGEATATPGADGDEALISFLDVPYVVNEDYERKPLRLMIAADLEYAAREYDSDVHAAKFEAAFMRALKKKVGKGTVGDHFTDEQIANLRSSIGGKAA